MGKFVIGYNAGGGKDGIVPGSNYNEIGGTGGAQTHTLSTSEMPAHSHSSNATGSPGYGLIYQDGNSTMNADVNGGPEPNLYQQIGALTINNTGGSTAHNNMPPYYVLAYIMKL